MTNKFKKGDELRIKEGNGFDVLTHWNSHWRREQGDLSSVFVIRDEDAYGYVKISNRADGDGPQWEAKRFELVTKFKAGDRVKCIDNIGAPYDFAVGECYTVKSLDGDIVECDNGSGMFSKRFELVAPAWTPNVGDRVRYKNADFGEATVVEDVGNGRFKVDTAGSANLGICTELIADIEPAPLKIEAGRYYRTRDGRKVGPMRAHCDTGNFVEKIGDGRLWFPDGSGKGDYDIIAEWPAEQAAKPRVNTAATVDAINEEYGPVSANDNAAPAKFKVGDRVTVASCIPGRVSLIGSYGVIEKPILSGKATFPVQIDNRGEYFFSAEELSLATPTAIVCLIEDGQPKPASRPYVHHTTDSAATEAKRMASVHKGSKFGVYALTGEPAFVEPVKVAPPKYGHEWQRLAMEPDKMIAAIKALREVSGIGLKAAKDAVEDWKSRQPRSVRDFVNGLAA